MLEKLEVHGFRTLVDTEVTFEPLTLLIGRNGSGKTSLLDSLKLLGNFARGGVNRAFGPPPWSLGWQRTRGMGQISSVRFEVQLRAATDERYRYLLSLQERSGEPCVVEERLTRVRDHVTIASFDFNSPPASGTILKPPSGTPLADEIEAVSHVFRRVTTYELNPSNIEQGNDPEHQYVSRDGFGVAGYLAWARDTSPQRFANIQRRLQCFRPETESIEVWSGGSTLYWGIRDQGQQRAFQAPHLSWGDRQLVGILCVLDQSSSEPGTLVAFEEVDRGFHPSRYGQVVELLSEAAYDGIDGGPAIQIVATSHSPSFVNQLGDRVGELRLVSRVPSGATLVRPVNELLTEALGPDPLEQPVGEIWELGMLEEVLSGAM
ncbi:MAG: AAA family ATPase [Planctomycetaceae bacterium]